MAMRKREVAVLPDAAAAAAAAELGASSDWAAAPPHSTGAPMREPGATNDGLNAMADWLLACGVDVVALQSTGMYWAVNEVLEQRTLKAWTIDARQVKYVPRRKNAVQDCQWPHKPMSHGLLRAAFDKATDVYVFRAVTRQREVLLSSQAGWLQRMQEALVQMNIQLTEIICDVMDQTGQAKIRDIVAGKHDPQALARLHDVRVMAGQSEITQALTGTWRDECQFVLPQALAMHVEIARQLAQCDIELQSLMHKLGQAQFDRGQAPRAGQVGALRDHKRGGVRRQGPIALRRTAAPKRHRRSQTPRHCLRLRTVLLSHHTRLNVSPISIQAESPPWTTPGRADSSQQARRHAV